MKKIFFIVVIVISLIGVGIYGMLFFLPENRKMEQMTEKKSKLLYKIDSLRTLENLLSPVKDTMRILNDSIEIIRINQFAKLYDLQKFGSVKIINDSYYVVVKKERIRINRMSNYISKIKNYPKMFGIDSCFIKQNTKDYYNLTFYCKVP